MGGEAVEEDVDDAWAWVRRRNHGQVVKGEERRQRRHEAVLREEEIARSRRDRLAVRGEEGIGQGNEAAGA